MLDGEPVAGSVGAPGGGASDELGTGVTVTDSEASLHTPETETLLASPLYVAIQRYTPATVGVYAADVTGPPATGYGTPNDWNTGAPAHVGSVGP